MAPCRHSGIEQYSQMTGPIPLPSKYLNVDDFHLHIVWKGQVWLEAFGQGHQEMQGGQQVLVEDG